MKTDGFVKHNGTLYIKWNGKLIVPNTSTEVFSKLLRGTELIKPIRPYLQEICLPETEGEVYSLALLLPFEIGKTYTKEEIKTILEERDVDINTEVRWGFRMVTIVDRVVEMSWDVWRDYTRKHYSFGIGAIIEIFDFKPTHYLHFQERVSPSSSETYYILEVQRS